MSVAAKIMSASMSVLAMLTFGCGSRQPPPPEIPAGERVWLDTLPAVVPTEAVGRGALLLSRFQSFEEFRGVVKIAYETNGVRLVHRSGGDSVVCELSPGISEYDFIKARSGDLWDKFRLALNDPFALKHRDDLIRVAMLARRDYRLFGLGDLAFYYVTEAMAQHISDRDAVRMSHADLSEKGLHNTFNHIFSQAFMTSVFSEELADYIATIHERYHMPRLISGRFSRADLANREFGPLDNYLDLVNNEWGQKLGLKLKEKYGVDRYSQWTPRLMADYLNDVLAYHSWAFRVDFTPFSPDDPIVWRFTEKVNMVMHELPELKKSF